jgi:SAM-dependent methyltransferase
MTAFDPRQTAIDRFAEPAAFESSLDVVIEYATDVPIALETLLDSVRPAAAHQGARVCELGFGGGWLLDEMVREFPSAALAGLDLSRAFTGSAHDRLGGRVAIVRGDMERLPFRDTSLDAIITCWTLYFMEDIDGALEEIRRCLKTGGMAVAATVAPDHMQEYNDLTALAVEQALGRRFSDEASARFDLVSGAPYVRRRFPDAELREWHGEMALPSLDAVMRLWHAYGAIGLTDEELTRTRTVFERLARDIIERDGVFRVRRHDGAFVATKR